MLVVQPLRYAAYKLPMVTDVSSFGQYYYVTGMLYAENHEKYYLSFATRYVALKIQKSAQHYTEAAMDEIKILKQIEEGNLDDKKCVVKLLDHFKHSGPNGIHVCMVFEFLGDNLLTLIKYSDYRGVPLSMVKEICFHIFGGLGLFAPRAFCHTH
ncbi:Protein kinase superfamily protein [Trifolium repens]|nr:Protein kinase superfamily protein [Trifolium repens]